MPYNGLWQVKGVLDQGDEEEEEGDILVDGVSRGKLIQDIIIPALTPRPHPSSASPHVGQESCNNNKFNIATKSPCLCSFNHSPVQSGRFIVVDWWIMPSERLYLFDTLLIYCHPHPHPPPISPYCRTNTLLAKCGFCQISAQSLAQVQ